MHNIFFFPTILKANLKVAKSGEYLEKKLAENKKASHKEKLLEVVLSGLEPPTHGFSVRCSTNWAIAPLKSVQKYVFLYTRQIKFKK